jgi:hypothetical protein
MADTVAGSTLGQPSTGGTNTQGLADWAAPYITNYLGKAAALADQPYQTYQGPLTAGPSQLQQNVFSGLAGLSVPKNLGQSFSSTGAYQPPQMYPNAYGVQPIGTGGPMPTPGGVSGGMFEGTGGLMPPPGGFNQTTPDGVISGGITDSGQGAPTVGPDGRVTFGGMSDGGGMPNPGAQGGQQPGNIAQQYMNPYLQSVLDPQLAELRRQNDITNMNTNAKLTGAGAFGGGRQAIMNAENNRNLTQQMNQTVGQGYANAYDKAMGQFNTEQGQAKDLVNLMSGAGATQRDIAQQGITADLNEFNQQRQYPYQQVQFMRDMISGLPTSSVTNTPGQLSNVGALLTSLGGGVAAAKAFGYNDINELLGALGLPTAGTKTTTPPP